MFAVVQPAAAPVVALAQPARWVCLDLETGDAPDVAIDAALEGWKAPANIRDPAKIAERRDEAALKIREKAALLDSSPILCVAISTDEGRSAVISGMPGCAEVQGWRCHLEGTERGLLLRLRAILDAQTGPETVLVGHNLRNFDLPKLRNAYLRHRLQLPAILRVADEPGAGTRTADTMHLFKAFSMQHRDEMFIRLDVVCAALGIPRPKQVISGADCPRLFQAGEYAAILTYCAVDVAATSRAYQLMTSQAPDLE